MPQYTGAETNVRKLLRDLNIDTSAKLIHVNESLLKAYELSPAERLSFAMLKAHCADVVSKSAEGKFKYDPTFKSMLGMYGAGLFEALNLDQAYEFFITVSIRKSFHFNTNTQKLSNRPTEPKYVISAFFLCMLICKVLASDYFSFMSWMEDTVYPYWSHDRISTVLDKVAREIFSKAADKWAEIDLWRSSLLSHLGPQDRNGPYSKNSGKSGKGNNNKGNGKNVQNQNNGNKGNKGKGKGDPFICFNFVHSGSCARGDACRGQHPSGNTVEERLAGLSDRRKSQYNDWKAIKEAGPNAQPAAGN